MATVTLRVNNTSRPVRYALRRAVRLRESESSQGGAQAADVIWHLPSSQVSSPPQPGGTITDDRSVKWTILEVREETGGTRFRCLCRNLALAERLNTLVSIQSADYIKSQTGAAEPIWADALTELSARIQPVKTEVEAGEDGTGAQRLVRVILEVSPSFVPGRDYRVRDSAGATYKILHLEQDQRLDVLPVLVCLETPLPMDSS